MHDTAAVDCAIDYALPREERSSAHRRNPSNLTLTLDYD